MIEPNTRNRVERAVNRVKLQEPVLLYAVPALVVLMGAFVVAGVPLWLYSVATVVSGASALAARASVYCESGHFLSLHRAASRWAELTGAQR